MYKRTVVLTSSALAACAAAIVLLWLLNGGLSVRAAPLGVLYVCSSGCTYSSIQAAVDAADPGDVIKVAQGTYTDIHQRDGVLQVVYISKTVTVRGGYNASFTAWDPIAHPTTLDAQGQGRVLYITGDSSAGSGQAINPTVERLRITGGDADGLGGIPGDCDTSVGGGVYVITATATIRNIQVFSNTADYGGGLFLWNSDATVSENTISYNTAITCGGGLFLWSSDATVSGNTIFYNTGGGVSLYRSGATVNGNSISHNTGSGVCVTPPMPTPTVCPSQVQLSQEPTCWARLNDDPTDYDTVQAAVDASSDSGDVVKVAGYCAGVEARAGITQTVYVSKTITIQGGYTTTNWTTPDPAANPTTLDAQGQGRVFYATGDITLTVEGLRITGGDADGLGDYWGTDVGGGFYANAATLVISGNLIYSNTAEGGGGLFINSSNHTTLSGNIVTSNTATAESGGGLYLDNSTDVTLDGNTFAGNKGLGISWGGGLYLGDSTDVTVSDNFIYNNIGLYGGGVNLNGCNATMRGNHIYSNTAENGGGVFIYSSSPILSNNVVTGNTAHSFGGGLYMTWNAPILVNNVVADNVMDQATGRGSGIYVFRSSPRLLHTTIARNSGGDNTGVHVTSFGGEYIAIAMTNTIIVSHTVGITVTAGSTATLNGTLWHANTTPWGGNVNRANDRSGDPAFAADGYHLTSDSMAIDRGVNAGVTTDVDSDTRPQGGGYDLGADEFPAASPDMVWNKQIRINGGSFQDWDSGPFTVAPGDDVTVVDRVWVTATGDVSFTLHDAWSPSLEWEGYEVTAGAVISSDLAATWSVVGGDSDTWHILTKTLRAVAFSDYVDTLTETLTVQGAAYQPPERIIEFQQPRPQPVWDKSIRINGGADQAWNAGPFIVASGDTVAIVDRVWITHTSNVTFTLKQNWGPGLNLDRWDSDAGTAASGTGMLTWDVADESANQWHTLTTTLQVTGTDWLYEAITEALTVEGVTLQPSQRVVSLFNQDTSTGCYARINDGSISYPTVQAAVDVAQQGDLVKVAGYCTIVNDYGGLAQVVYLDKRLTIRGGYTTTNWTTSDPTAYPTVLDAQGQGRVLYITGDIAPTVEGLQITGGDADGLGDHWGYDAGGGVYIKNAAPVISGNLVYSNTADIGGGVYLYYSNATLNANNISNNTLSYGGEGGGLYLNNSIATLNSNTIKGNEAPAGRGGGICLSSSPALLSNNVVTGNTSSRGGGVYLTWSNATLNSNVIAGNVAAWSGGGLDLDRSDALLVNNVVVDNQAATKGSGIYVEGFSPRLLHTTIARNSGGDGSGIHVTNLSSWYSTVAMTNTIIAGHTVGITVTAGSTATLNGTLWHANIITQSGNVGHTNDHSGDPAFASDGYHLTAGSAAIDQGVASAGGVTTDVDNDARPIGLLPDLGADEWVPRIYLPLVLR